MTPTFSSSSWDLLANPGRLGLQEDQGNPELITQEQWVQLDPRVGKDYREIPGNLDQLDARDFLETRGSLEITEQLDQWGRAESLALPDYQASMELKDLQVPMDHLAPMGILEHRVLREGRVCLVTLVSLVRV